MGRRLYQRIGAALAAAGVALAAPAALARQDAPAPTPAAGAGARPERPLELPSTPKAGAPPARAVPEEEGPAPFPTDALPPPTPVGGVDPPADLGPPPATAGPAPAPAPGGSKPRTVPGSLKPEPVRGTEPRASDDPPAPADPETVRAQAVGLPPAGRAHPGAAPAPAPAPTPLDGSALPAAAERPGQPAPEPAAAAPVREGEAEFVLPADRLPVGRQNIGLTVEVVAPPAMNIGQSAALKVVVRNSGSADAQGVVVRDQLPEGLVFVSSQPEAQRVTDSLLSWHLGTVAAGSERVITLSVKPSKVGAFEHAATVIVKAGGRSRTVVREPRLKLELTPATTKVLRGQPVEFKVAVTNTGDGPARRVVVQARLSPGLRHESGEPNDQGLYEQEPIEVIQPGERLVLPALSADTVQGGEQTCQVEVQSPDVVAGSGDAKGMVKITVVEPKLTLTLSGPDKRFTDQLAKYELVLENPGSAAAKNVKVQATVPVSGRLYALPPGARWDPQTRRLSWTRPQLDAGEKAVFAFEVRMGGAGIYQVAVESRADSALLAKETKSTDVSGIADVQIEVSENRRVVDVGDVTVYRIKIVNKGTKEATGINVSAKLSDTVEPQEIYGTETDGTRSKADPGLCVFPQIPRLSPGKMIELGIRVQAVKPGSAFCRVFLTHDESADDKDKLEDFAHFKVTAPVRR